MSSLPRLQPYGFVYQGLLNRRYACHTNRDIDPRGLFTLFCGVPIYNDRPITTADRFYSLGFDIQFIEYYERLAQKRKNAQTQKRLAEAAREQ